MDGTKEGPNCMVPHGLSTPTRIENCNIQVLLLVPFIVGHLSVIANHLLLGNRKARNKIRFWSYEYLKGDHEYVSYRWSPWSALQAVVWSVAQAVGSATILRAMGLGISIGAVALFYLTKPRVGWVIPMLSPCIYEGLVDTSTDILFQECLLGLLALPSSIAFMNTIGFGDMATGCDPKDFWVVRTELFQTGAWGFALGGSTGLIACGAFSLGIGIAMLWKRRFLRRGFGLLAMVPCVGAFICSWFLWIGFTTATADGSFCSPKSALGPLSALSVVVPFISAILRSWVGYPGAGGQVPK